MYHTVFDEEKKTFSEKRNNQSENWFLLIIIIVSLYSKRDVTPGSNVFIIMRQTQNYKHCFSRILRHLS